MPSHRSHGRTYVEPPRHDELPAGLSIPKQVEAGRDRRANGQIAEGATTVPSLGGQAQRGRTQLSHRISEETFDAAGRKRTRTLRKSLCTEYRQTVGNGTCGVGASLLLRFVAILAELSEQALRTGDGEGFRRYAESAKTTLAYAREEAARVGEARSKPGADGRPKPGWIEVKE